MRIALTTWSYDTFNGISRCVAELARRLSERHEISIFSSTAFEDPPPGVRLHVERPRIQNPYLSEWEFFYRAGRLVKDGGFDIVHMHFPVRARADLFTSHGVAQAALDSFRRFPADARFDVSLSRVLPYYIQIPLYSYHLRNKSTLVAAVSEKVKRDVMGYYGRAAEDIIVIPNGVDTSAFSPANSGRWRGETREALGIGEERFVFLFVGHHLRHKGARYALEAVSMLPEKAVLLIVGCGSPGDVPDPGNVLPGLLESGRAVFAGLKKIEVWKCYAASDAFIFPSLYESFALVILEAMASGVPVITAKTVALGDELIRDGVNGFVVESPWDVRGMAQRAKRLMEDKRLYRSIAERAVDDAQRYSWGSYALATEAAYGRVTGRTGKAALTL